MRQLVYVVPVALAIYALFDVFQSEDFERAGLPRALWALIVIVVPVLGPAIWIVVSRVRRAEVEGQHTASEGPSRAWGAPRPSRQGPTAGSPGAPGSSFPGRPGRLGRTRRPAGPTAPDDDPEFLRELERQWHREERGDETDGPSPDDPGRA